MQAEAIQFLESVLIRPSRIRWQAKVEMLVVICEGANQFKLEVARRGGARRKERGGARRGQRTNAVRRNTPRPAL